MPQRLTPLFSVRSLRSRRVLLGVGAATLLSTLLVFDASSARSTEPLALPDVALDSQTADRAALSSPADQSNRRRSFNRPAEPVRCALTRLDVIHEGVVRDRGDSILIELADGGSIAVSKLDVLFVGANRDEVFAFKKSRTRLEDVAETLRLADWASRRRLGPHAIALLEAKLAEPLSDGERRAVAARLDELRRSERSRLLAAQTLAARRTTPSSSVSNAVAPEVAEIERWAKELPLSAFDRFGRRAHPILHKRCATAGCHDGSNPNSAFRVRPKGVGAEARLALLFNLRETFDFVDFNNAAQSRILNHPPVVDAKGRRVYPFGEDRLSAKDCQAFVAWVESLDDGKLGRYVHRPSRVRDADAPTLRPDAVSRYDRVPPTTPTLSNDVAPNAPTPSNPNPFAELFDAQTQASPNVPPPSTNALSDLAAPSVADADDPNSPENVLRRGGYAPKQRYRDEYDPAIFNAAAPGAPTRY
ncbi:MAG: hypothetical protein IKU86_11800 [Thermoguttaceae bacterium]|nr:hypothetical protein [Thermoguttaceae bacterium]